MRSPTQEERRLRSDLKCPKEGIIICRDPDSVSIEQMEEDCSPVLFTEEQHHAGELDDKGSGFPTEVQALDEPVTASLLTVEASTDHFSDIAVVDASIGDPNNKCRNVNSHSNSLSPQNISCCKYTYVFGSSEADESSHRKLEASTDNDIDSNCIDGSICKAAKSFRNFCTYKDRTTEIDEKITTDDNGDVEVSPSGDDVKTDDDFDPTKWRERNAINCSILNPGNTKIHGPGEETAEVKIEEEKEGTDMPCGGDPDSDIKDEILKLEDTESFIDTKTVYPSSALDSNYDLGDQSGTEEEQSSFMMELETFFKERSMEFKPPKFYGEGLNCLKLWRAVIKLGGYEQVTSSKLWRQVGELFNPPKTCTTVSWTFRCFYEKALLEFEKYKLQRNVSPLSNRHVPESNIDCQISNHPTPGRARRDAAARAMQGWHSNGILRSGEDENVVIGSALKRDKPQKSIGLLKRKKPPIVDHAIKAVAADMKATRTQFDRTVMDIGTPADWVKINVHKTLDCFEVYVLVPGLLREEVNVQSDPVGRLVITGRPEDLDNPWGVTPFKKVVCLPSRIDAHQTSAVVTLYGQLFVRVPFEHSS